jgi:ABC-type transporter Mla subunit MlaD
VEAKRILGAFTDLLDGLGADQKLVRTLNRVHDEVIPEVEGLVRDVDQALERAAEIKHTLGGMRDAIVSPPEED